MAAYPDCPQDRGRAAADSAHTCMRTRSYIDGVTANSQRQSTRTGGSFRRGVTPALVALWISACASTPRPAPLGAGVTRNSILDDAKSEQGDGSSAMPSAAEGIAAASAKARSFLLPIEIEHDQGAANGSATLMRVLPLYRITLPDKWELVNIDLVTLAEAPAGVPGRPGNPNPVEGGRAFGLGDITHASLLERSGTSPLIFGLGLGVGLPTATDEILGSGKWTAGPAMRLTYRTGSWNLGALALQRWSFAGESDRAEVSQFMTRGTVRRQLPEDWYLVSAPIITANWSTETGERWLVPLGGGVGRTFLVGERRWAISLQGYYNIVRPDGAPEWALRISIIPAIPAFWSN